MVESNTRIKFNGERHVNVNLTTFINRKIDMLANEFYLRLTDREIEYFYTLKTEGDVNAYVRKLLIEKL